ncbi:hypothetical protein ACOME3_003526 [Neoechinorhynchus agilis]
MFEDSSRHSPRLHNPRSRSTQIGQHWFHSWHQVMSLMNKQIGQLDKDRRFCAVCGNRNRNRLIKCAKCSMIYYCGPEHKNADQFIHQQCCEKLHFTALGQIACSIPALPPFPTEYERWPVQPRDINSWDQWMRLHPNLTTTATETASILCHYITPGPNEHAVFDKYQHLSAIIGTVDHLNSRSKVTSETMHQLTSALLALVTDYLSYPISMGMTIYELLPPNSNRKSINVTILPSPSLHELIGCGLSHVLQAWMRELGNMFPSEQVINVIMRDNDELFKPTALTSDPRIQSRISTIRIHRGKLSYTRDQIVDIVRPDMAVCFNPFLFAKHSILSKGWQTTIDEYVQLNVPLYITFSCATEYERAFNFFTDSCRSSIVPTMQPYKYGRNPFGSRLTRQDTCAPNSIYSRNSYHILLRRLQIPNLSPANGGTKSILSNLTNCSQQPSRVNRATDANLSGKRRSLSTILSKRKVGSRQSISSSSSLDSPPIENTNSSVNHTSEKVPKASESETKAHMLQLPASPSKRRSLRSIKARQAAKRNENQLLINPFVNEDPEQEEIYRFESDERVIERSPINNYRLRVESVENESKKPTLSLEEIKKQLEMESEDRRYDEDQLVAKSITNVATSNHNSKRLRHNSD